MYSCYLRFEIRPFAILPTISRFHKLFYVFSTLIWVHLSSFLNHLITWLYCLHEKSNQLVSLVLDQCLCSLFCQQQQHKCDGSEVSKICYPIHSNKMERVPQPCLNENYRKLLQLHACRARCLFLLKTAKNHHPQWVAICPCKRFTLCWKSCSWIRRSCYQQQLLKECKKENLSPFEHPF